MICLDDPAVFWCYRLWYIDRDQFYNREICHSWLHNVWRIENSWMWDWLQTTQQQQ